ncbi:MAG: hypothetical protein ACKO5C_09285 [Ferruginibacter sp.]
MEMSQEVIKNGMNDMKSEMNKTLDSMDIDNMNLPADPADQKLPQ